MKKIDNKKISKIKKDNNKSKKEMLKYSDKIQNKDIKVKKRRIKKNVIFYPLMIMFAGLIIFSLVKILFWHKDNKKTQKIKNEVRENIEVDEKTEEYTVDFASLKEKNPDTVAWIKINGTNVDYPIVKTTNNDYYLIHSFDKTYSEAGWIFINYKNTLDGTDKNISIFGHARLDDSMFGSLRNAFKTEWQQNIENTTFDFYTESEHAKYQIFSIYRILVEDYYLTESFNSDDTYLNFLNTIKNRSMYNYDVELTSDDQIITLSTCDIDNDYRLVIHAKKIKEDI